VEMAGWASLDRGNLPGAEKLIEIETELKPLDEFGITNVDFIKIDVEGFEDHVLAGMSFAPKALSFEFHFALLNIARASLNNSSLRNGYCFNYIDGIEPEFRLDTWVSAGDLERILTEVHSRAEYGDVFCRKVSKD